MLYLITAAAIRRGNEILLVRQQGTDDPATAWALPGGVVEPGELAAEALIREVKEETGVTITGLKRLLYMVQFDNRQDEKLHNGQGGGSHYLSTALIFEADAWSGTLQIDDPDGFIQEAVFVPVADAIHLVAESVNFRPMREPLVAYLKGDAEVGSVWMYRGHVDGETSLEYRSG